MNWRGILGARKTLVSGERFFYHSFPRPNSSSTKDDLLKKGLSILENVKNIGMVVAPEIIEWKQPLVDGTERVTRLRQKRISFTELERTEVAEHGKKFGPFSIEFKIDVLRRMGALPVIYMPQSLKGSRGLSSLGTLIVTQLGDVKYTIDQLQTLLQLTDPNFVMTLGPPGTTQVAHDYKINLQNTDDQKNILHHRPVPANYVRDVLDYIGFKNSPFELMGSVLSLVQTLFYPTDDEFHDDLLSYYRQREWRIVGGLLFNGIAHGRALVDSEKTLLMAIDNRFWSKEITDDQFSFRRIDEAVVISEFEGKPITSFISAIIVPPEAYDKAKDLFGEIVMKGV
jgi:hypothetical protein